MKQLFAAVCLLILPVAAMSATWHVAKDGSGDFTAIQDAIDAASPGDLIRIHAGRYEELIEGYDVWENNTVIADVHVAVTKDDLTLQGDGSDSTIIGFAEYPSSPPSNFIGITVTSVQATSLTVSDLAIENVRYGMYVACPACDISNCRFEGMVVEGVRFFSSDHGSVESCEFVDCGSGITTFAPSANISVSDCDFNLTGVLGTGCMMVSTSGVLIRDCHFSGGGGAINFQQGTDGVISGVVATSYHGVGLVTTWGGGAELYDSYFEGGYRGVNAGGQGVVCERSSFIGHSYRSIDVNSSGISRFNECEIINGGGESVRCQYNGAEDCHLDMTNCDWGTDAEEQIAEWIHDATDDSSYCCTVDFVPFKGQVAVEQKSWTSVKGLFGGGAE